MKLSVALRLGRVSNLPTTWSNVATGLVLSGASFQPQLLLGLCCAISSLYVGGMYLNDAFDREHDARERPERPIPAGAVAAGTVFAIGFSMLGLGVAAVAALAFLRKGGAGVAPVLSALGLCALIVFYDLHHKRNLWSPLVMAGNRVLVYVTAALSVGAGLADRTPLIVGSLLLCAYLIGLTYIAKQENLQTLRRLWPLLFLLAPAAYTPALTSAPGRGLLASLLGWIGFSLWWLFDTRRRDVKRAVSHLIAGISLLDALLCASAGQGAMAALCVVCFGATLVFQRRVAGT
jgi:4-hydroxybenzoate polyprenyltransferase